MAAYKDDVLFNKNTSQVGHFLVERETKDAT